MNFIKEEGAILFIDEIHNIVGAGSNDGSLDLANILRPFLSRADIKCIGATTLDEYYRFIDKDKALKRRFQNIYIDEPTSDVNPPATKHVTPTILVNFFIFNSYFFLIFLSILFL